MSITEKVSQLAQSKGTELIEDGELHPDQEYIHRLDHLFLSSDFDLEDNVLLGEVHDFFIHTFDGGLDYSSNIEEQVSGFIEQLRTEKEYETYIFLPGLRVYDEPNLPIIEVKERTDAPEALQDHYEEVYTEENKHIEGVWGRFTFSSKRMTYKLEEEVKQRLVHLFGVINICTFTAPSRNNILGCFSQVEDDSWTTIIQTQQYYGPSVLTGNHEDIVRGISEIVSRESPTPLEKRIMKAMKFFDLHNFHQRKENAFLPLIAGLEKLLIQGRGGSKADKLARRSITLLDMNWSPEEKLEIYSRIKNWYNLRSKIIHGHEVGQVNHGDIGFVKELVREVVRNLLSLRGSYTHFQSLRNDEGEKEGIRDYLLKQQLM